MINETMEWTDAQTTVSQGEPGLDILGAVWRRKWMVLVVAVVGVGLGYLYYLKAERVYRSSAQILLVKKEAGLPDGTAERAGKYMAYEDTLSTHMILVRSSLIARQALDKHGLGQLASLRDASDPVAQIIGGLRAARAGGRDAPDPNVMDLTYEGPDPGDCEKILLAIVTSYQEFLGTTYENISKETTQLITEAKDEIHQQLTQKELSYRKFRQESPLIWKGSEGANLHEARLADIEKARAQVLLDSAQTKARVEAIEAALKRGGNREALALLIGNTDSQKSSPRTRRESFDERVFTILLEEQALLEQFGPDHPKVRTLRKQTDLVRAQLSGLPAGETGKRVDFLSLFIESLKEELKIGDQKRVELDKVFDLERESARKMSVTQLADEQFRGEIARMQQMFNQVIKRLQEINLLKDYNGISTRLIAPPAAGVPVKPKLVIALSMAALLGLMAGFGMACLGEIADKSFRSPDQIRRQLGLPVIAHIPIYRSQKKAAQAANGRTNGHGNGRLSEALCTVYVPRSREAEAFRAVRTSLYFSAQNEGYKLIQVTSPNPGDGKTTLAANLAVAIADSGKKTLLIDGDFRRPRVHRLFALDHRVGLCSVIRGEVELPDATQATAVKNLWGMPCGPRPENPADLLTSPRFKELLDVVREQYDFVVIDSPPLLAVTDPSVIAARADAVLLTIRLSKHGRYDATRATEMLASLGTKILGVVVNAVQHSQQYGYAYGNYRYGYGYNYRYHYGYGYGSHGNGHYYDESPDDQTVEESAKAGGEAAEKT